jgi:hypothetical protein
MRPRRTGSRDPHSSSHVRLDGRTLYDHVRELLPQGGRGPLPHGGEPLPDEPPPDPARLRWSAGSLDGVLALRGSRSEGNEPLAAAAAVVELARTGANPAALRAIADQATKVDGPQAMDRFVGAVVAAKVRDRTRMRDLARWLCVAGVRREQVKVGLALLGVYGTADDVDLVTTLGLLEELTLYAAVAVTNLLAEPDLALLDLADQVDGWGRIHCVRRLRASTRPEVRRWLLYGGYHNRVMVEEIAFVCASTGRLLDALRSDPADELLDHAGALLAALAIGGPAEDMRDYADGGAALAAYLYRMRSAPATLRRLRDLRTLDDYLHRWADGNERIDATERDRLTAAATEVLARPEWRDVAAAALHSDDLNEVKSAITLVRGFGLDPVPTVRRWLPSAPQDAYLWQTLVNAADADGIRELVALADQLLPFSALPRGPAQDLGAGPGYEAVHCLDVLLQRLREFPGEGERAIRAGLESRVTRCRNMALRAVEAWPVDARPADLTDTVTRMAWSDPDDSVKKRARRIAAGLPGDEPRAAS